MLSVKTNFPSETLYIYMYIIRVCFSVLLCVSQKTPNPHFYHLQQSDQKELFIQVDITNILNPKGLNRYRRYHCSSHKRK